LLPVLLPTSSQGSNSLPQQLTHAFEHLSRKRDEARQPLVRCRFVAQQQSADLS
jgi:hypothetical protein